MYKFNRLAFGIKGATAIFKQIMDTLLSGIEFEVAYLDEILLEEHRKIFSCFKMRDEKLWKFLWIKSNIWNK